MYIYIYRRSETFVSSTSILAALDLCMKNNYFTFNEKIYKQINGVGTGIKLAPTWACLGMGKFEKIAFSSNNELLERILLWKRFIDDVLMLFQGSKEECDALVAWLNTLVPGVRFKSEFSYEKIEFLDLLIFKEDGKLKTDLYIKPTNKQLYLDFNSNHPSHCKKAIPYSQALRVVERCPTDENKASQLANLNDKLIERNYPAKLVDEQIKKSSKER